MLYDFVPDMERAFARISQELPEKAVQVAEQFGLNLELKVTQHAEQRTEVMVTGISWSGRAVKSQFELRYTPAISPVFFCIFGEPSNMLLWQACNGGLQAGRQREKPMIFHTLIVADTGEIARKLLSYAYGRRLSEPTTVEADYTSLTV